MARLTEEDGVKTMWLTEEEYRRADEMSSELTKAHYAGGRPRERCDEQWSNFMRDLLGRPLWNQVRGHEDIQTKIEPGEERSAPTASR